MRQNILVVLLYVPLVVLLCSSSYRSFLAYLDDLEDKSIPHLLAPPLPRKAAAPVSAPLYDVLPTEVPTVRC